MEAEDGRNNGKADAMTNHPHYWKVYLVFIAAGVAAVYWIVEWIGGMM